MQKVAVELSVRGLQNNTHNAANHARANESERDDVEPRGVAPFVRAEGVVVVIVVVVVVVVGGGGVVGGEWRGAERLGKSDGLRAPV